MKASDSNQWFAERLSNVRMMAILRGYDTEAAMLSARRLWGLGIELIEVPLQRPQDFTTIRSLSGESNQDGKWIGAGTITSVAAVQEASDANASFLVCPGFDEDVIHAALDCGLAILPGVSTASEIQKATGLGLEWVKAFPAGVLGTEWIRAMQAPFPQTKFVATGGIDLANMQQFIATAHAVALGSAVEELVARGALPGGAA